MIDRRFLISSILIACALWHVGCEIPSLKPDRGTYEIDEVVASPGNKFKAFIWLAMGGGAAGWCVRKVSVLPSTETLPLETDPAPNALDYVFSTRCSSDIKVIWMGDGLLKISHSLGDDPLPTSMSQASRTKDGSVRIIYELLEK